MPFLLREAGPSYNLVFVYVVNSAESEIHLIKLMMNSCKIAMEKNILRVNIYNKLNSILFIWTLFYVDKYTKCTH